eukprot:896858-Amorphochlora_amoeboformis.AAC.1
MTAGHVAVFFPSGLGWSTGSAESRNHGEASVWALARRDKREPWVMQAMNTKSKLLYQQSQTCNSC